MFLKNPLHNKKSFKKTRKKEKGPNRGPDIDIFLDPKRRIVSLKKRTIRIELTIQQIKAFVKDNVYRSFAISILLLLAVALTFSLTTKANIGEFYATSCLGGWENPQNAEGSPETRNGSAFSQQNSAVLKNTLSEIFCGGFSGEIPQNSKPAQATLYLSLFIEDALDREPDLSLIENEPETPELENEDPNEEPEEREDSPEPQSSSRFPSFSYLKNLFGTFALAEGDYNNILEVSYTTDGANWTALGNINRNSPNPVLFSLPSINWQDMSRLQVSVRSLPQIDNPPTVYLDALWIEVEYSPISSENFIRRGFEARVQNAKRLSINSEDIITSPKNFKAGENVELSFDLSDILQETVQIQEPVEVEPQETPQETEETTEPEETEEETTEPEESTEVQEEPQEPEENTSSNEEAEVQETDTTEDPTEENLTYLQRFFSFLGLVNRKAYADPGSLEIVSVSFTAPNGEDIELQSTVRIEDKRLYVEAIRPSDSFKPGRYETTIEVIYNDTVYVFTQDFTWGVLALNFNKSVYAQEDEVYVQMAVLTDRGSHHLSG
jgi:hypothetical protein